jgi:hypothetical protein
LVLTPANLLQAIRLDSKDESFTTRLIEKGITMKSWAIYIVAALGFGIYGVATEADRDGSGAIVGEGNVDAFQVRVGDCFDDSSTSGDEISDLPGVPCSKPHDNEAYAVFDLSIASYPDNDSMGELAQESCLQRFDTFVGRDYESSSLDIFAIYPTTESWAQKDREVICAIYDMEENKLVGSAQGRAL